MNEDKSAVDRLIDDRLRAAGLLVAGFEDDDLPVDEASMAKPEQEVEEWPDSLSALLGLAEAVIEDRGW